MSIKMSHKYWHTPKFRLIRKFVYRRDRYKCKVCGKPGTTIDHIKPVALGGSFWELDNLQCICRVCHAIKTDREARVIRETRKQDAKVWRKFKHKNQLEWIDYLSDQDKITEAEQSASSSK